MDFAWSPDDTEIVYSATRVRGQLRVVSVAGTEEEKGIFQSEAGSIVSPEWSPDGQTILFIYIPDETRTHRELWAFDVEEGTASPVLENSFNVFEARFAPNGQWYAYMSDEGGTSDVWIRAFPDSGAPIRVSAGGGGWPRWSGDGSELFYLDGEGYLAVVQVEFRERPVPSVATILTDDPVTENPIGLRMTASGGIQPFYDVHPDGQRFLLRQGDSVSLAFSQLIILRDWIARLEGTLAR